MIKSSFPWQTFSCIFVSSILFNFPCVRTNRQCRRARVGVSFTGNGEKNKEELIDNHANDNRHGAKNPPTLLLPFLPVNNLLSSAGFTSHPPSFHIPFHHPRRIASLIGHPVIVVALGPWHLDVPWCVAHRFTWFGWGQTFLNLEICGLEGNNYEADGSRNTVFPLLSIVFGTFMNKDSR